LDSFDYHDDVELEMDLQLELVLSLLMNFLALAEQ
jgi:hypothetical protein